MKKLSKIQQAQAALLWGYLLDFKQWPQSLPDMIANWEIGFFDRKSRKRDLTAVLNHLAETGKIQFETIQKLNGMNEIGFRITSCAK